MPEQDAPQQRPAEPPRALLPEFLHQGGAAKPLEPEQRRQLVASGGTSRLESVNYGDAILTDNWPRDGLLLARSTVAEKIVVEQYKIDRLKILEENTCQQWWPARAISVEEYLEYYASTPARFRPKVDAVAAAPPAPPLYVPRFASLLALDRIMSSFCAAAMFASEPFQALRTDCWSARP